MSKTGLVAIGPSLTHGAFVSVGSQEVLMPEGAPDKSSHWFLEDGSPDAGEEK